MLTHSNIVIGTQGLEGDLCTVKPARGLVLFAHGSSNSRNSRRNQTLAQSLQQRGLSTLMFGLLTPDEADNRANAFNVELLTQRILEALDALPAPARDSPLGLFGADTASPLRWSSRRGDPTACRPSSRAAAGPTWRAMSWVRCAPRRC